MKVREPSLESVYWSTHYAHTVYTSQPLGWVNVGKKSVNVTMLKAI